MRQSPCWQKICNTSARTVADSAPVSEERRTYVCCNFLPLHAAREDLGDISDLTMHRALHWVSAALTLAIFAPVGVAVLVDAVWSASRMSTYLEE